MLLYKQLNKYVRIIS